MKESGVHQAVTMTTNKDENEAIRKTVEANAGKLHFAMWLVPDEKHLAYLEKHHEQIKMVKFHPSYIKIRLDDPKMAPFLKVCEREMVPILVHCGRWLEIAGYNIALDVAERCETDILLAHMGGVTPSLVRETVDSIRNRDISNAFLVTSGMARTSDTYWLDQCPPYLIRYAIDALGADQIMLGSDYPFGKQNEMTQSIKDATLQENAKQKIFSTNAKRILHIK
jgi:predicted TIM-barrel fold metal-dependent hydrolase